MIRQYELVDRVRAYHSDVDENLLNRAYVFAMRAHGSQKRASGDPYFSHPLEVAAILTDLRLDDATIVTALLHDTIEDTETTHEDILRVFGDEIAALVDGVTKLSQLELTSERTKQAENFRKLILAMSNDIRVLLVKLADRLHNMRTLHFIAKPEKRRRIAEETVEIYAPLAGRIGMQGMRDELEDLAFAEVNPDGREQILARLARHREQDGGVVSRIADALRILLAEKGIEAQVKGREKRPYSIWKKMERKTIAFEQLSDLIGFRVIVDDVDTCYDALGHIHRAWAFVPGRFKDYISTPKRNGYRSLHTTVIGPEKQRVEIQIRTQAMEDIAERGVAAHWNYKDGAKAAPREIRAYEWLRELVFMLEQGDTPEEFLEHTKLEMFHDQVFCFTPKGDLIGLPRGATPVDFAYAVHTDVGNKCVGAKVNGQRVPLPTVLQNGDQVEILLSDAQSPSPTWESFAVTGKARSAIRRYARMKSREQYVRLGRRILERAFEKAGVEFSDKAIGSALPRLKVPTADEVFLQVGQGMVGEADVLGTVYPETRRPREEGNGSASVEGQMLPAIPIRGLVPGHALHLGTCCRPIPGDRIVGIFTPGEGVTVHTIDCARLPDYFDEEERWLDLAWDQAEEKNAIFAGRLEVEVLNEKGALGAVANVIARNDGNIDDLHVDRRNADVFTMSIAIEVRGLKHLENIKAALRAMQVVTKVSRDRGERTVPGTRAPEELFAGEGAIP
ncbi:RelA/SpoT family protein [Futiania mangrovi]|uniref:GTP pyrophosphokinase rsh n=1 Tax=Futiania mangrovi TaxID=2959716 RepID=A0A9J6PE58_9PROT|nr:bifunctional (p)ppGpp synthetase/guanosine-3',5'-bis(diphosphate) 3'-pyrophosphohydrolase [Futiania mangrovii]MCP1336112.1 bifunctional (p)ppGpp synthetase/guanosine-3',5'-bis(diphosphate) 3'-pyrophosphohydrolase [Futiania mangrovii]